MLDRVRAYYRLGDFDKSLSDAEHVILMEPANAYGWAMRGDVYVAMSSFAPAIRDYSEAIHLPNHVALSARDGILPAGDFDSSLADTEEAIRLAPSYARAFMVRGHIKKCRGKIDDAFVTSRLRSASRRTAPTVIFREEMATGSWGLSIWPSGITTVR